MRDLMQVSSKMLQEQNARQAARRAAKAWEAYRKPLDTLKSLYDEACAARDAANGTPSWDYLDRRCATLAREIDDFVRGRANAINAGNY